MSACPKSQIPNSVYVSDEELETLVNYPEDENGIPIVPEEASDEEPLYREEVWQMLEGKFTCPIDHKTFDNIIDFIRHWNAEHKDKYGIYKDFRKYIHEQKESLSNKDIYQMLKYWLRANKKN